MTQYLEFSVEWKKYIYEHVSLFTYLLLLKILTSNYGLNFVNTLALGRLHEILHKLSVKIGEHLKIYQLDGEVLTKKSTVRVKSKIMYLACTPGTLRNDDLFIAHIQQACSQRNDASKRVYPPSTGPCLED